MSYPNLPNFPNVPPQAGAWSLSDPGRIPLRPLGVGDLLGGGLGVVWRHIARLAPIAVLFAALSSAVELVTLHLTGTLRSFASGVWVEDLMNGLKVGHATLPTGIYVSATVSSLVTVAGALFLSAVVAACAGADALDRTPRPGAVADRLRGRLGAAAVVAVIVGAAMLLGSFVLVVPGVLAFVVWSLAAPVTVMERSGPAASLARSARLTRGHRWRILGVMLLIVIITVAIESVVSSIAIALVPSLSDVAALIVGDVVTALVSAITLPWVSAVIALLYVDVRLRTENLGQALRMHAARQG